jgi:hypothetical protein
MVRLVASNGACRRRPFPPSSVGPPRGGKTDFWLLLHPARLACISLFIMSFPRILNDAFQLWRSNEQ